MEPKDFMVGDWIILDGESMQIECIKPYEKTEEVVEPIPLTKEIIKLNGFKYTEFQDGMFSFKREWIIIDSNNKYHTFVIRLVGVNEYMVFDYVKIKYIHELQHALRLYGFSELADNFKIKED